MKVVQNEAQANLDRHPYPTANFITKNVFSRYHAVELKLAFDLNNTKRNIEQDFFVILVLSCGGRVNRLQIQI